MWIRVFIVVLLMPTFIALASFSPTHAANVSAANRLLYGNECWRSGAEGASTISSREAIGFIFANDKLVIVNPYCKADHYYSTLSEKKVEVMRSKLIKSPKFKRGKYYEIIGFRSRINGKAFSEHGLNLFFGEIANAVALTPRQTMRTYYDFGGR